MLNIELQSAGLLMLVVTLVIFLGQKSLDLRNRTLYFRALLSNILCVGLDIVSIIAIDARYHGTFPVVLTDAICKLYIMSLCLQAYLGFRYAAGEFFGVNSHRILKIIYTGWLFAGWALMAMLPISTYIEGRVVYSYGPSTLAAYAFTIPFIISTIVMAFVVKDQVSNRRRRAILVWQGVWLAAAVGQLLLPELLLVGFASCFGMVILYAELENPHEGIDRMTGQFTVNALGDYVRDCIARKKQFASLHIRIEQLTQLSELETTRTIMLRASAFLEGCNNAYLFREADDEFVLVFPKPEMLDREYRRISDGLADAIQVPVRVGYIVIPNSSILLNADEFFRVNHHLAAETEAREMIVVDAKVMEDVRKYSVVRDMILTALEDGRVEVYYQPVYDVIKDRFTSAEALVRIRDLDGSIIPPATFIPIAEENGMIVPLGLEVFTQVCDFLATGKPQMLGIERIEVNVSVAQFDRENPYTFVRRIMAERNILPQMINLEITETYSAATKQILLRNMQKLIDYGVHFSLDDFGTGRSNLDYFIQMPVDIVKFDYTFVQNYFVSDKARAVLESSIELIHRMHLSVVAEGVETEEQLEAMKSLGVEYIQGFYFSRPIPMESFENFLLEHNFAEEEFEKLSGKY